MERQTRQILVSMVIIGIASSALGAGTFAFFSDTGSSTSNLFTAGTVDLHLNGQEGVQSTLGSTQFLPGEEVSGTITLTNTANADDADLDLDVAFDVTVADADLVSTDMAKFLEVKELTYGGSSLLACFTDANANGRVDLHDLDSQVCADRASPGSGGTLFGLKVGFHDSAGNDLQGDAATLVVRFLLAQKAATDIASA